MARLIEKPSIIEAAGTKPKKIEEFVGRVASETASVSVARMTSPPGWEEPAQTPEFDEFTVVLDGELDVTTREGTLTVAAGQAVVVHAGERVQYTTPNGAHYIAVCLPAFSPDTVHRDE